MNVFIILFAFLAFAAAETYSTDNDDVDVEKIVSDNDTLQAFMGCFTDRQPCDEVQADFKKDLSEVVQQACAKCTAAQKHLLRRFLEASKVKLPKGYADFKERYDPDNKYFTNLETAIANA